MIHIKEIETATYQVDDDTYVDVIINRLDNVYEAYVYYSDSGKKEYLFGLPIEQQSYEEFLRIVESNI